MIREHHTVDLLAGALAISFDDDHRRENDLLALIHHPDRYTTPLINPMVAFADAISTLATYRKTVLEQAVILTEHFTVRFSMFGDEYTVSLRSGEFGGPVDVTVATEAGSFHSLMSRMARAGLLQQALAELTTGVIGWSHWTIDRFEMIKPVENILRVAAIDKPASLLALTTDKAAGFRLLGEDLEMLTKERVVVGLRNQWARRVATPMWQAHRAFSAKEERTTALTAMEIIRQCQDVALRQSVEVYLAHRFAINMEQVP